MRGMVVFISKEIIWGWNVPAESLQGGKMPPLLDREGISDRDALLLKHSLD
jgi:hypothetical protein